MLGKRQLRRSPRKDVGYNHLHSHPLPLLASYIVETFSFKPSNVCMCKGSAEERERSNTWWTWLDTQCGNGESTEKMKFKFHPRHHVVDDDKNGTRLELSPTSTDTAHRLSQARLPPLLVCFLVCFIYFCNRHFFAANHRHRAKTPRGGSAQISTTRRTWRDEREHEQKTYFICDEVQKRRVI